MKKVYSFFFLLVLLPAIIAFGQESSQSYFKNVSPPAPNAASLGKYGDIPVSLATGTPNISIPLGELKQGPINIPIQLNYHASGNKVEEIASWVGLGWSLNAGGVITRTVRGKPDEFRNRGYFDFYKSIDPSTFFNAVDNLKNLSTAYYDAEPDKYFFNFLGYSGEILIDHNIKTDQQTHVFLNPHQDIKIEPVLDKLSTDDGSEYAWVVKLPDGTLCYFGKKNETVNNATKTWGAVDKTETILVEQSAEISTTSWYLAKVVAPNQIDVVTFEYGLEQIEFESAPSETIYMLKPGESSKVIRSGTGEILAKCENLYPSLAGSYVYVDQHYITKISSSTQVISFDQDMVDERKDLFGAHRLKSIKFIDNTSQLLKEYELFHSYIESDGSNSSFKDDYRLKLDEIKIKDKSQNQIPGYSLEYYSSTFPNRLSFKRDHWGFYNDNTKETAIPREVEKADGSFFIVPNGGSREVDITKANTSMLKKITYPTGGSSSFVYEPHTYSYVGNKKIEYPVWKNIDLSVDSRLTKELTEKTEEFTVTKPYIFEFNAIFEGAWNYEVITATASLIRVDNNNEVIVHASIDEDCTKNSEGVCRHSFKRKVLLEKGTYKLVVEADYLGSYNWGKSSIFVDVVDGYRDGFHYTGGVRIAEIINNDGNASLTKKFIYHESTSLSSGVLVGKPLYLHSVMNEINVPYNPDDGFYPPLECYCDAVTASSKVELGTSGGSHLSYGNVKVINGEGYKVHTFTTAREYPDGRILQFPFPPSINRQLLRGKEKSEAIYAIYDKNNVILSLKTTDYNFDSENGEGSAVLKNNKIEGYAVGKIAQRETPRKEDFRYEYYDNKAFNPLPVKIEDHVYFNGVPVSTTTTYEYDANKNHNQVVRKVEEVGAKSIITYYTYPTDKTEEVYQEMVRRNIVASPVAETVSIEKNGQTVAFLKKQLHYYSQTSADEPPYLQKIEDQTELVNGTATEGVTVYEVKEYTNGRVWQEETLKEGSKVYLWSSDNKNIIAVAVNATNKQLLYYSFEEDGTTEHGAKTGNKSLDARYTGKVILRPAAAGNYLITYFKKEDNKWEYRQEPLSGSSTTLTGIIDEVRVHPVDAFMTTYTYKPGVGVSSVTDPTGQTVYYDYDDFGRLLRLRDNNNNILQQYEYKYASE